MSVKARGGAEVVIDGQTYPVLLTLRGIAGVEDATSFIGVDGVAMAVTSAHTKAFNCALVECLVDAGMDREQAMGMNITAQEFHAAFKVIKSLFLQLYPKKAPAGDEAKTKTKTSGPTG